MDPARHREVARRYATAQHQIAGRPCRAISECLVAASPCWCAVSGRVPLGRAFRRWSLVYWKRMKAKS